MCEDALRQRMDVEDSRSKSAPLSMDPKVWFGEVNNVALHLFLGNNLSIDELACQVAPWLLLPTSWAQEAAVEVGRWGIPRQKIWAGKPVPTAQCLYDPTLA